MQPEHVSRTAPATAPGATQTVLTFGLGEGLFALPVAPVLEILDIHPIAPLPRAPRHLLGLIDRRGVSVPVVDMRMLLGQPEAEDTHDTRIVVLRIGEAADSRGVVGVRVDRVTEVTVLDNFGDEQLAESSFLQWKERIVAGIGRRNGQFVTLLDVGNLFDAEVMEPASRIAGSV